MTQARSNALAYHRTAKRDVLFKKEIDHCPKPEDEGLHEAFVFVSCQFLSTWILPMHTSFAAHAEVMAKSLDEIGTLVCVTRMKTFQFRSEAVFIVYCEWSREQCLPSLWIL